MKTTDSFGARAGRRVTTRWWAAGANVVAITLLAAGPARGQSYSIDYQGPSMGVLDSFFLIPITEGDILTAVPGGPPGPPPAMVATAGGPSGLPDLGIPLWGPAVGHPGGIAGFIEVDALSYGMDTIVDLPGTVFPITWTFSVDEFAFGLQPPVPMPPNVSTEGAFGFPAPPPPGQEASADVFATFPPGATPPGIYPAPPFATPPGNLNILDGDGLFPVVPPYSLGLIEPNIPAPGPFDGGDNLDALDVDFPVGPGALPFPVYFSMDSGFVIDFIEGIPGTGSALANFGFSGADVLVTPAPGAVPFIYAPAFMLGLDLFGPDTDDLDALVLLENGDGIFTPPAMPYDWDPSLVAAPTDMIFFSVRRGSAIIGTPDFFLGLPIVEGDILFPPPGPGMPPGIWHAAENLGLCTARLGMPPTCPPAAWGLVSDDLDALDVAADCDDNGVPDAVELYTGVSGDCNGDGVPDNCDCFADTNGDCVINGVDLVNVILDWGTAGLVNGGDVNGDGIVDGVDLVAVILNWGPC